MGGPCGPYFQTQRTDTYEAALQKLIDAGAAYPCFCTKEELDAKREAAEKTEGGYAGYDRTCRAIPADEASARIAARRAPCLALESARRPRSGHVQGCRLRRHELPHRCDGRHDPGAAPTARSPTTSLWSATM